MKRGLVLALIIIAMAMKGDQPFDRNERRKGDAKSSLLKSLLIDTVEVVERGHVTMTEQRQGVIVVEYAAKTASGALIMEKKTVVAKGVLVAGDNCIVLRITHKDAKGGAKQTVLAVEDTDAQ